MRARTAPPGPTGPHHPPQTGTHHQPRHPQEQLPYPPAKTALMPTPLQEPQGHRDIPTATRFRQQLRFSTKHAPIPQNPQRWNTPVSYRISATIGRALDSTTTIIATQRTRRAHTAFHTSHSSAMTRPSSHESHHNHRPHTHVPHPQTSTPAT